MSESSNHRTAAAPSSKRICESCLHSLDAHLNEPWTCDGFAPPCLTPNCRCACFVDPAQRAACSTSRGRNAVWDQSEMAVVHRRRDGTYRFPPRNDAPTPADCERVEIRSDADMARVERESGTLSERRWFDRGSGRGHETDLAPVPRREAR